jgi:hypothetical protein
LKSGKVLDFIDQDMPVGTGWLIEKILEPYFQKVSIIEKVVCLLQMTISFHIRAVGTCSQHVLSFSGQRDVLPNGMDCLFLQVWVGLGKEESCFLFRKE